MLENIFLCTIIHDVRDCISHVFECVFGTAQIYWSHVPKLSHNLASCRIILKHKNAGCNGGKIITKIQWLLSLGASVFIRAVSPYLITALSKAVAQDVRKKGSKILKLPRFPFVLH